MREVISPATGSIYGLAAKPTMTWFYFNDLPRILKFDLLERARQLAAALERECRRPESRVPVEAAFLSA